MVKKLQVFVSSTFADLKEERQAAVKAILDAGHIPAGMELFAAGDAGQLPVIKQWIDDCDVYLLILGGRYGSLDEETKQSYTQIEYRYAKSQGKASFALPISDEELKRRNTSAEFQDLIEQDPEKAVLLRDFRREVTGSQVVRFWSSPEDVQIAVGTSLGQFAQNEDLIGWVKADTPPNAMPISNRESLYVKCAEVVQSCKEEIFDTSWGRYPRPLTPLERTAREFYRESVDKAMKRGLEYRELFSQSEKRNELILVARDKRSKNEAYRAKQLTVDLTELSILDYMVGDRNHVILSHVDAEFLTPSFLYIESTAIAEMFRQVFIECWQTGEDLVGTGK